MAELLVPFLRILGKTYTLELVPPKDTSLWYYEGRRRGGYADGSVGFDDQKICVSTDVHEERQLEAIVHETIHVLDHALRLNLDEEQVHRLAAGLAAVVFENGWSAEILSHDKT